MPKFPVDAPVRRVIKALELLGFTIVRGRAHLDGSAQSRRVGNAADHAESANDKGVNT